MPQRISPGAARRSSFAAWSCVVWGVAAWLVAGRAAAQEEPGRVEVARGALVASPRVLGLGGAYVAVAQGRDGLRHNAAAPAVRAPHSVDHVELYFGFDLQLPAVIPGADLFNDDDDEEQLDGLAILSLGAILQAGSNGFGLLAEGERFGGGGSTTGLRLSGADFGMVTLLYARGFAHDQLIVGAGPRLGGFTIAAEERDSLFGTLAVGGELGVLWRPNWQRYRVGANFKTPLSQGPSSVETSSDATWSPEGVSLPWQASVGFAYQFGPRPFNPRWKDPSDLAEAALARDPSADPEDIEEQVGQRLEREYEALPRFYVLVSTELAFMGSSSDAGALSSVGEEEVVEAGEEVTLSPRVGVESEVWPHRLKLRAGSYGEAARLRGGRYRVHGTFGFDLKMFRFSMFGLLDEKTDWQFSTAVDAAREYLATSFSIGTWH